MEMMQQSEPVSPPVEPVDTTPRAWRVLASLLFVATWMALGFLLHLDGNTYLVVGIPLTVIFQVVVKGEPLRALWLRSAPRLELTGKLFGVLAVLIVVPAYSAFQSIQTHAPMAVILWIVACLGGAVAAGYALQRFDRVAFRALMVCLATGGLIAVVTLAAAVSAGQKSIPDHALLAGLRWFLLYFPATFVMEEVSFRGGIDAYVHRPGDSHPWLSAFFVSALWGLWHLPIVPHPTYATAVSLVTVHSLLGVPLSFAWRRSGNLAVPAAVHAFADAVRNALGLMG